MSSQSLNRSNRGFTLIETVFVVFLIGALSAIAVPSWLSFMNLQRLNTAQDQLYRAMQEAKSNAKRDKITWQVSFREVNDVVQWAIHPAGASSADAYWQSLERPIDLDQNETTLYQSNQVWRVQFNYSGHTNGQLGKISLKNHHTGKTKRCVLVSTLIGTLRTAKENRNPKNGKYCY